MSMESVAWSTLYQGNRSLDAPTRRPIETMRRMGPFARPHRWRLAAFLALSVFSALLAVATPLLAGRVVDRIVGGGPTSTVVQIALLVAAIAIVGAGVDLLSRWFSSRIGEGLIYQLRTAVFDHVQTMPVAFFTRTRTGALVSRRSIRNSMALLCSSFPSGERSAVLTVAVPAASETGKRSSPTQRGAHALPTQSISPVRISPFGRSTSY